MTLNILYLNYNNGILTDLNNNEYYDLSKIPANYELLMINTQYKQIYNRHITNLGINNNYYELDIMWNHLIYKNIKFDHNIADFYEYSIGFCDYGYNLKYYNNDDHCNQTLKDIEFDDNNFDNMVYPKNEKYFMSMLPCIVITGTNISNNSLCNVTELKKIPHSIYIDKTTSINKTISIYLLSNLGIYTKRAIKK